MGKVRKRFFVSAFLIAMIPILFAFCGYIWSANLVNEITNDSYVERLTQTMNEVERSLDGVAELSQALANTTWVKRIAYMQGTEIDYGQIGHYELSQCTREIGNYVSMNTLVEEIGVAFNRKRTILSSHGVDSYDWYFSRAYQVEGMTVEQWADLLDTVTDTVLYPQAVQLYDDDDNYITYIKTMQLYSDNILATPSLYNEQLGIVSLIIMIRDESMAQLLRGMTATEGSSAYILDENGRQVTALNGSEEVLEALREAEIGTDKPYHFRDSQQGEMYAFSVASKENGWRYVAVLPVSEIIAQAHLPEYTLMIFVVTLAALLAIWGAAQLFSKRSYAPIETILENISRQTGDSSKLPKGENEYQYIGQKLEEYYRSNSDLANRAQIYTPFVMHSLFVKLLYGILTDEGISLLQSIHEIPDADAPWNVLVVLCETPDRESVFRTQINRVAVNGDIVAFVLSVERQKLAVVTNASTRSQMEDTVRAVLAANYELASQTLHIGIGRRVPTLWAVSTSFSQANRALQYEPTKKERVSLLYFDEIARSGDGEIALSYKEELVIGYVNRNQPEQIVAMIDAVRGEGTQKSQQALLRVQCLYYNLLNTAFRLLRENGLDIGQAVEDQDFTQTHSVRKMKESIASLYTSLCAVICHHQQNALRRREDILFAIEENCTDDAFNLQVLSEQFGLSVSYLSKYIKQQTGENFVDYVGKKRIAMAKKLLAESDENIEQVGRNVGYYNALTFRRAFKKYEGITPGAYRDTMKGHRNE